MGPERGGRRKTVKECVQSSRAMTRTSDVRAVFFMLNRFKMVVWDCGDDVVMSPLVVETVRSHGRYHVTSKLKRDLSSIIFYRTRLPFVTSA